VSKNRPMVRGSLLEGARETYSSLLLVDLQGKFFRAQVGNGSAVVAERQERESWRVWTGPRGPKKEQVRAWARLVPGQLPFIETQWLARRPKTLLKNNPLRSLLSSETVAR